MTVNAPGKLIALTLIALAMVGYIIAAIFVDEPVNTTPAWSALFMIIGYLVGDGANAVAGRPPAAVFTADDVSR